MILAFCAGAVSVGAFAPLSLFPLSWLGLAVLVWLLHKVSTTRQGFCLGLAWGLGFFLCGVSWLFVSLHRFGGLSAPLAAMAILLFCCYLALFPALAAGLFVKFRRGGAVRQAILFASLWAASELLRGSVFTGFPWLSLGYSQLPPSPLGAWFPLVGVYGVGLLAAGLSAWLALLPWRQPQARIQSLSVILALVLSGFGLMTMSWTVPTGEPLRVALVQTNVPQDDKWDPDSIEEKLLMHLRLVAQVHQQAQLLVLPESTLPLLLEHLPEGYLDFLAESMRERGADLVIGVVQRSEGRIYNSAISVGVSPTQGYSKRHLVPFGEYSPPLFRWFYRWATIPLSNQSPGALDQTALLLGSQQVAINICYEDLFGRELLAVLPQASLLLNMSNLAWFGHSLAQPQHLEIARARAMETGRPMLRATNTGMTAVVQPDATVSAVLPTFEQGVLYADVQGYHQLTPYGRWGDWAVLVLALLGLLLSVLGVRR